MNHRTTPFESTQPLLRKTSLGIVYTIVFLLTLQFSFASNKRTAVADPSDVIVTDNGTTVTLKNGLVTATITKSTATVTSLIYNGIELIKGGYNGG